MFSRCCTRNVPRLLYEPRWQTRRFLSSTFAFRDAQPSSLKSPRVDYEAKYAEKLQKKAQEEGISVDELKQRIKEQGTARRMERLASFAAKGNRPSTLPGSPAATKTASSPSSLPAVDLEARKDSSPVKPLSSYLNIDKLLETPHTAEQISLLWLAYHSSRSGGTGRGYLCATIPVATYEKMLSVSRKYPTFVLPIPRDPSQDIVNQDGTSPSEQRPYEFFFMEWGFHGSPPEPQPLSVDNLFAKPTQAPQSASANPQTTTVLFTPLGEYKLRNSFATPYMVLTNYTDLARSHGIVLLRGEITPSTASDPGAAGGDMRFLLSQQDAQLLAVGMQKYYLWDVEKGKHETLLKTFHEDPSNFKWEELLKHADLSA